MNSLLNNRHNYSANISNGLPATFSEILEHFFGPYNHWENNFYTPESGNRKLDVKIHEKEVCAKLAFPGCRSSDFEVEVVGDDLTVKASHSEESKESRRNKNFIRRERSLSSIQESIHLPVKVKGSETRAKYEDGVLTVIIPRENASSVTNRVIEVN